MNICLWQTKISPWWKQIPSDRQKSYPDSKYFPQLNRSFTLITNFSLDEQKFHPNLMKKKIPLINKSYLDTDSIYFPLMNKSFTLIKKISPDKQEFLPW